MKKSILLCVLALPGFVHAQKIQPHDFSFALYSQMAQTNTSNIVVSPLSAQYAVSILAEAVKGYGQTEIIEAVGFETLSELEEYNSSLRQTLESIDRDVTFETANSIWTIPAIQPKEAFVNNCYNYYNAQTFQANIQKREGLDEMDSWVASTTHNRIKSLQLEEDPSRLMSIVNTLYFKAPFAFPFKSQEGLQCSEFKNSDGSQVVVPAMTVTEDFNYACVDGYEIVELPLGQIDYLSDGGHDGAESYSMILFSLPSDIVPAACLSEETFRKTLQELRYDGEVKLTMPKFDISTTESIKNALQALGICTVFTDDADYSNISDLPFKVEEVKQLCSFGVDEVGIEGAAATGIDIMNGMPHPIHSIVLDHPFQFIVTERNTKAILFIGAVNELENSDPEKITTIKCDEEGTASDSSAVSYDLSGHRLTAPVPHGVFIEDGKRVMR